MELNLKLDAAQTSLVQSLAQRAEKEGKGIHSVEYWAEECFSRGRIALVRQFDAAIELRNQRGFASACAEIKPANPSDAKDVNRYMSEMESLKRKYQIGGTPKEV